jgi:hypothetical protein
MTDKKVLAKSRDEKDYTFHGVAMTQVEFAAALAKKQNGQCPLCDKRFKNQYGAMNRHIISCPKRPA